MRALLFLAVLATPAAHAATVEVVVAGVRSGEGHVRVAVCDAERFLAEHCAWNGTAAARAGSVTVRVDGVPPGRYAAQAFHDEQDSGRMHTTWLGLPVEGMGFSRDAPMRFGPPTFADAAFAVGPQGARTAITLRYY